MNHTPVDGEAPPRGQLIFQDGRWGYYFPAGDIGKLAQALRTISAWSLRRLREGAPEMLDPALAFAFGQVTGFASELEPTLPASEPEEN